MYGKAIVALISIFSFLNTYNYVNASEVIPEYRTANYETILKKEILNSKEDSNMQIDSKVNTKTSDIVKVIVELNPISDTKDTKVTLKSQHDEFKEFINELNKNVTKDSDKIHIKHEYDLVLNGMSLSLPGNKVPELLKCNLIKKIWNDNVIQLDPPIINPINKTTIM